MHSYEEDNKRSEDLASTSGIDLRLYSEARKIVEKSFSIEDTWVEESRFVFNVKALDSKSAFLKIKEELIDLGFLPFLRLRDKKLTLIAIPKPSIKRGRWVWNLMLLLMTIGTTTFVGYQMS
ncbi:MAG: hypothetical protein QXG01_06090, partial [Candidatus Bathyarchaeia archaeon]